MPQITQVTPQKTKGFFNVFIDGRFAFGLDSETLVKEKIAEDKNLTEADVKRLKETSLYSKLLNSALNFLSFRPRSKKELSGNLKTKVYKILGKGNLELGVKLEAQVISKIEALGYLNDEEFARWWVEQRTSGRNPRGPALIKKELFGKGVGREIIEGALGRFRGAVSAENLREILARKGRLLKNKPRLEQRRKLYAYLIRRGFDFEASRAAVDEYLKRA